MGQFLDLTGMRFGRLTVKRQVDKDKFGNIRWLCECDCGGQTTTRSFMLNSGRVQSCGCLRRERIAASTTRHGDSHSRLYKIWLSMKSRCNRKTHKHYYLYGGKGIRICNEWNEDYTTFKEWACSNGYSEDLTLDRIDPQGNYEPCNCRWVTMHEQSRNKSTNVIVSYHGETGCLTDMCRKLNVKKVTVRSRMRIHGLTFEEAIDGYAYTSPFKDYSSHD